MSCNNCMLHRPPPGSTTFTCPECNEVYVLANVWPGNYWEAKHEQDEERQRCNKILDDLRKERENK